MLRLSSISKIYSNKESIVSALDSVDLYFNQTGFVGIIGESGSGKTTLLNIISLLDNPTSGEVLFFENNIFSLSKEEQDLFRREKVGYISQSYNLLENISVEDNLSLCLFDKENKNLINDILKKVKLLEYKTTLAKNLSGGQKQRVAIARTLLQNPDILICDEPTSALDKDNSVIIYDILKELSKDKLIIVSSHDYSLLSSYADRLISLEKGKIVGDQIKSESKIIQVGNNSYTIRSGTKLSNSEVNELIDYLSDSSADRNFSISNNYTDNKNKEEYEEKELSFERKKTSFKPLFNIVISILKNNKWRFAFSIILMFLCLSFIGTSLTFATYNEEENMISETLADNNSYASFDKYSLNENKRTVVSNISKSDIEDLKDRIPLDYYLTIKQQVFGFNAYFVDDEYMTYGRYYNYLCEGAIQYDSTIIDNNHCSLLSGSLPTNDNDILLTSIHYELFKHFGYKNGDVIINPSDITINSLINKTFKIGSNNFIIKGIIDTKISVEKYQVLKNVLLDYNDRKNYNLYVEWSYYHNESPHCFIYTSNLTYLLDSIYGEGNNLTINTLSSFVPNDASIAKKIYHLNNKLIDGKNIYKIRSLSFSKVTSISSFLVPFSIASTVIAIITTILSFIFIYIFSLSITKDSMKVFGIIRSCGYSEKTTIASFLLEPLFVALLSSILSLTTIIFLQILLNDVFKVEFGVISSVFGINFFTSIFLVIIALIISILSTFISFKALNKKSFVSLIK